ncbi:hypothetical protein F8388_021387 [Cannabis sativa]|uniref:Uncharacterized protein n=1 Tax=Cannabis sativa TaxID=3483 RepID=A0A7J6HXF8_CANSA|nr:hypothetical protein F8388_021387 [Cannabis sativa]KAF4399501.1 hypothetical protein G4B88_022584 [Cannabis sativa]
MAAAKLGVRGDTHHHPSPSSTNHILTHHAYYILIKSTFSSEILAPEPVSYHSLLHRGTMVMVCLKKFWASLAQCFTSGALIPLPRASRTSVGNSARLTTLSVPTKHTETSAGLSGSQITTVADPIITEPNSPGSEAILDSNFFLHKMEVNVMTNDIPSISPTITIVSNVTKFVPIFPLGFMTSLSIKSMISLVLVVSVFPALSFG